MFLPVNLLFLILYVTNASSFPKPLSSSEEKYYLELAKSGDMKARNTLVERNLRLVAHIIKKYYAAHSEQDDLISIGTIGLIKAISSFDSAKGTRLATYASRCIENEILMYFRTLKKSANDISLNEPIDGDKDGNTISFIDILSGEDTFINNVDLEARIKQLYEFLSTALTAREREILILRYGLYGTRERTQLDISKKLGISRSYVSRIEKKALLKLADAFKGSSKP